MFMNGLQRTWKERKRDVGIYGADSTGNSRWHKTVRAHIEITFSRDEI